MRSSRPILDVDLMEGQRSEMYTGDPTDAVSDQAPLDQRSPKGAIRPLITADLTPPLPLLNASY